MPTFRKQSLKPGRFRVNVPDGTTSEETFTKDRIKAIKQNTDAILAAGWLPPAPWKHDGSKPITKAELANGKNNAGFVLGNDYDESTGELTTRIEVPLEEDAKRVGTTVKEVSPYLIKDWTDPTGRIWSGEIMSHLAFITNPIQPGQENFIIDYKPAPNEVAIAMSMYLGPEETPPAKKDPTAPTSNVPPGTSDTQSMPACLDALRQRKIDLPEDTTMDNLVERIIIACRAITGADAEGENNPDGNSTEQPQPIAMSQNMSLESKLAKLLETANATQKATFRSRINALKAKGLNPQFIKDKLEPLCEGYTLSQNDDGSIVDSELEIRLSTLEAQYARPDGQQFQGNGVALGQVDHAEGESHPGFPGPWDQDAEISDEQLQANIKAQLSLVQ